LGCCWSCGVQPGLHTLRYRAGSGSEKPWGSPRATGLARARLRFPPRVPKRGGASGPRTRRRRGRLFPRASRSLIRVGGFSGPVRERSQRSSPTRGQTPMRRGGLEGRVRAASVALAVPSAQHLPRIPRSTGALEPRR
jgi:hypothetical protein